MKTFPTRITIIISAGLLTAGTVFAGPFAPDKNTLFLAHFDKDVVADQAMGEKEPVSGYSEITSVKEGKFGGGLILGKETLAKNPSAKKSFTQLTWPLKGNLDLKQGTVEFWVKFDLFREEKDGHSLYYFFDIPSSATGDDGNPIRTTIALVAVNGKQTLYAFPGKRPPPGVTQPVSLAFPVSWEKGQWHHVALTWTPEQTTLFVDGKKGPQVALTGGLFSGDTQVTSELEDIFLIGGLWKTGSSNSPEGVIDEFRISANVRYNDDFDPTH